MVMDKYDIIWETFQDDLIETRKSLLKEKLFADVTLVSDDMTKILAHRTVLSSASSVFKQLLMLSHDHGHPVLFLRGVKHEDLQYIVEFIYSGQVSLPEERVQHFIDSAQDLGISSMEKQDTMKKLNSKRQHLRDTDNWTVVSTSSTPTSKKLPSLNYQKSEKVEAEVPKLESNESEGIFYCKVCDYKTKENCHLKIHVRRNHTKTKHSSILSKFSCGKCSYTNVMKDRLEMHRIESHQQK